MLNKENVTVNDLIKILDTKENRYGATGKPRMLNLSLNGNFAGSIESVKLDGYGDGLITDVTMEITSSKFTTTNADRIRNMSDEELAEFMAYNAYCEECYVKKDDSSIRSRIGGRTMRLIDADVLIEHFEKLKKESTSLVDMAHIIGFQSVIDAQPTAYDPDKVVQQLKDRSTLSRPVGWSKSYEIVTLEDAIEIVKAGGADA